MPHSRDNLISEMLRVFPQRSFAGRAAPHECSECEEINAGLAGKTWVEVPRDFLFSNFDALPLLSKEAYVTFLPAWLREGLLEPDQGVAGMLMVNLSISPPVTSFTPEQASTVVSAVRLISESGTFGSGDPVNVEYLATIERLWSPVAV